jgi:hypothetical protein
MGQQWGKAKRLHRQQFLTTRSSMASFRNLQDPRFLFGRAKGGIHCRPGLYIRTWNRHQERTGRNLQRSRKNKTILRIAPARPRSWWARPTLEEIREPPPTHVARIAANYLTIRSDCSKLSTPLLSAPLPPRRATIPLPAIAVLR